MMSILAAHYGSVEDIEVLWSIIAIVGACFSVYNIREAYRDLRALSYEAARNGRGKFGRLLLKNEIARLIIQLIFLTIGILAMTVTSGGTPPGTPLNLIILGIIFRWGLITASLLVSLISFWAYQTRREILFHLPDEPPKLLDEDVHLVGSVDLKIKNGHTSATDSKTP